MNKTEPALVTVRYLEPDKETGYKIAAGVIVGARGVVIAPCSHVRRGAELEVVLHSGARLPAKVIHAERKIGLAVLKIEGDRFFPHVELADSDQVETGDAALALSRVPVLDRAHESSLDTQVVLIGAKNRRLSNGETYVEVGSMMGYGALPGLLVDEKGNLLGLITRRGLTAFAVPSNRLKEILSKLRYHVMTK